MRKTGLYEYLFCSEIPPAGKPEKTASAALSSVDDSENNIGCSGIIIIIIMVISLSVPSTSR